MEEAVKMLKETLVPLFVVQSKATFLWRVKEQNLSVVAKAMLRKSPLVSLVSLWFSQSPVPG